MGSTGWLKSLYAGWAGAAAAAGLSVGPELRDATFPADAAFLSYFVREPFPSRTTQASMVVGRIEHKESLVVTSEMAEHGVIFSDGLEADYLSFNAGTKATIGLAERQGLLIV